MARTARARIAPAWATTLMVALSTRHRGGERDQARHVDLEDDHCDLFELCNLRRQCTGHIVDDEHTHSTATGLEGCSTVVVWMVPAHVTTRHLCKSVVCHLGALHTALVRCILLY